MVTESIFLRIPRFVHTVTLLAVVGGAFAQNPALIASSPSQVVRLTDFLQPGADQTPDPLRYGAADLTASGGTWAVLMRSSPNDAQVVIGNEASIRSFPMKTPVESIVLDENQRIHVLARAKSGQDIRTITVLDANGSNVGSYTLPTRAAIPFRSAAGLLWWGEAGFFHGNSGARIRFQPRDHGPDASVGQFVIAGTAKLGVDFTFGDLSELITLYARDGSVLRSYPAPLDDAYRLIGADVPKMPIASEHSRVLWATPGDDGLLYVCLSGVHISRGAFVAVFDPDQGRLSSVIGLELPSLPSQVSSVNPKGYIFPGRGAIGNKLILADQSTGLLAIY